MHYTNVLFLTIWLFTYGEAIPGNRPRIIPNPTSKTDTAINTAVAAHFATREAEKESRKAKENPDREHIIKIDQALQELDQAIVSKLIPAPSVLKDYWPPKERKTYPNGNICHTRAILLKCWWYANFEIRIDDEHTELRRKALDILFDAIYKHIYKLGDGLPTNVYKKVMDRHLETTWTVWNSFNAYISENSSRKVCLLLSLFLAEKRKEVKAVTQRYQRMDLERGLREIDRALQELGGPIVPDGLSGPSVLNDYAPPQEQKEYASGGLCYRRMDLLKCWWYLSTETRATKLILQMKAVNILFDALTKYESVNRISPHMDQEKRGAGYVQAAHTVLKSFDQYTKEHGTARESKLLSVFVTSFCRGRDEDQAQRVDFLACATSIKGTRLTEERAERNAEDLVRLEAEEKAARQRREAAEAQKKTKKKSKQSKNQKSKGSQHSDSMKSDRQSECIDSSKTPIGKGTAQPESSLLAHTSSVSHSSNLSKQLSSPLTEIAAVPQDLETFATDQLSVMDQLTLEDVSMLLEQDAEFEKILQQEDNTMLPDNTTHSKKAISEAAAVSDSSDWLHDGTQAIEEEVANMEVVADDLSDLKESETSAEQDTMLAPKPELTESVNKQDFLVLPWVFDDIKQPFSRSRIQFGDQVESDDKDTKCKAVANSPQPDPIETGESQSESPIQQASTVIEHPYNRPLNPVSAVSEPDAKAIAGFVEEQPRGMTPPVVSSSLKNYRVHNHEPRQPHHSQQLQPPHPPQRLQSQYQLQIPQPYHWQQPAQQNHWQQSAQQHHLQQSAQQHYWQQPPQSGYYNSYNQRPGPVPVYSATYTGPPQYVVVIPTYTVVSQVPLPPLPYGYQ